VRKRRGGRRGRLDVSFCLHIHAVAYAETVQALEREYVHCVQKSKNNWLNKASYLYQCRYCSLTKECPPTTLGPIS